MGEGYSVADAPPRPGDVVDEEPKVGGGEEEDEDPGQDLEGVPGAVPAVATRIVELLQLSHSFLHLLGVLRKTFLGTQKLYPPAVVGERINDHVHACTHIPRAVAGK